MKKQYTLLLFIFAITFCNAQIITIPDTNFRAQLFSAGPGSPVAAGSNGTSIKIDANNDGQIQVSEAQTVYQLDVASSNISSLTGIESFTNLRVLRCFSNNLTSLNVTSLVNLTTLFCNNNSITALNTGVLTQLTRLYCNNNAISSLNLSNSPNLSSLDCYNNQLTSLNLTGLTGITVLRCQNNLLTSLNVSGMTSMTTLYCQNNLITSLNVNNFTLLYDLWCNNNALTSLSMAGTTSLFNLYCQNNQLTTLSFAGLNSLSTINCSYNNLTSVDVSVINHLSGYWMQLNCSYNPNLISINTRDSLIMSGDYTSGKVAPNATIGGGLPPPLPTTAINFQGTTNLQYFCADAAELAYVQNKITTSGYTNPVCQLSSTCEFLNPLPTNTTTASACDSYIWAVNNQTYTASGTYTVVTATSTEILNLTIIPSTNSITTITTCGSYNWPINSQTYTASGTYTLITGCQTQTLNLTIFTPSIISHPANACSAINAAAVFSASSNMPTPVYTWQYRVVSPSNPNPAWIDITSVNAGRVYTNYTSGSLTVTRNTTLPLIGTEYRAIIQGQCGSLTSNAANILFTAPAQAGIISVPTSVCAGGIITFSLSGFSGTSIQWQSAPTATETFINIPDATSTSYTITNATATLNKSYRAIITNSCSNTSATTAIKTIKVDAPSVAGSVSGGGIVCVGSTGTLKVTGNTGSIQWQYATDGVNYSNAPKAADNQAGLPFTTSSISSIGIIYSLTNITAEVYFRAKITSGACSVVYTNQVHYTIGTAALSGTILPASSYVCSGTGTTLTLTGSQGAVTWQRSSNWATASPTWSNVTNSAVNSLVTPNLIYNTAFRVKVTIGTCSTVYSDLAIVNLYPKPLAKPIKANTTSPSGLTSAAPLCTDLSIAKTYTVGTGYVGAIQWERSTTSTSSGFTEIAGATGETYTVANPVVGANYFRVRFTNICGATAYSGASTLYYTSCGTSKTSSANSLNLVAYPNPFKDVFGLKVISSNSEEMRIAVYDMTGKLLEMNKVMPAEIDNLSIGNHYAAGIYNVVVTQGSDLKTIRIVKK